MASAYGARNMLKEINRLVDIADLGLISFAKASKSLAKAMESENPWERYWACITASAFW